MTLNRRTFIKGSAATAAAFAFPFSIRRADAKNLEDIRLGVIGINGRGKNHISGFGEHVVALCDCDSDVLGQRAAGFDRKIDTYQNFRELLDRKDIDAVSIATPNHTHSLIAIEAIQAGKHVYCEKPVSHNVWEGRQLVNASRKYDKIVQCGTQSRSSLCIQEAVKYVRDGHLGKIQFVMGTCFKPRKSIGKLDTPLQIPSNIDYDLWCGPAAKVDLYRPELHYDWHWDFNTGNGDMGNQGIHQMDVARWFLGVDTLSPSVLSIGGRLGYDDAGNTPNTQTVLHNYPEAPLIFETRGLPKSKAAQADWAKQMDEYRGSRIGVVVQCEQGWILVLSNGKNAFAYDNDGNEIQNWEGDGDHFANFLEGVAANDRSRLNAEILEGHLSSALCHTGSVSHLLGSNRTRRDIADEIRGDARFAESFERMAKHLEANEIDIDSPALTFGQHLKMDTSTERFVNDDRANELLTREYRAGFVVPEINV